MTQRHVDLLMKAIAIEKYDFYLCNRIGYITGYYHVSELRDYDYNEYDYIVSKHVIQSNIRDNLSPNYENIKNDDDEFTYFETKFYLDGMTRKEWAETILAPLFLAIEEESNV